ncbi:MAG: ABC transporter ATP-binding protein [Clostridia bacterium]|nr:ABC transporter ATP-binding protein [Clostridia bacterium]
MKKPSEYRKLLKSLGTEWKWLLKYVVRYKLEIFLYVVIGIAGTVMGLGSSVASKYLIDAVVTHNNDTIAVSAALVIGMALTQIFINAGTSRITSLVGTRIKNEVRSNIYEHIVLSRWEDINKYHSGELINRLEGDVSTVSNSIITFVPSVFTRVTQFVGCLAIVLYYDPTMAIFAFLSSPFLFFSSKITTKMMRKYNKESREMNGKILSFSEESMQNLQTIKAFDLTRKYTDNFKTLLGAYRKMRLDHDKFSIIMTLCLSVIGLFVSYACYGWGVLRLWQGVITYGTMTLFLQISGKLTTSFSALVSLAPSAISIATSAGRIMEFTDLPIECDADKELAESMMPAACEKGVGVEASDLTYTYNDSEQSVLNNISFSALPGETIAFVGPSGEGKTTILRLILGLVEPDCGKIEMSVEGGSTIQVSDSTRRFCSYVPQGNAVFSGTIADNLRIVNSQATDEELIEALKIADAWNFVEALPNGLDTIVGERGVNFSEGQIQRISIARAVLRKAPVLVMDEATSALDAQTEERVLGNLMASYPNRTCIITTHRPSMLQYCQRVYRLSENGVLSLDTSNEQTRR